MPDLEVLFVRRHHHHFSPDKMLLRLLLVVALLFYDGVGATSYSERKDKDLKPYSYEEDDIDKGGSASKGCSKSFLQ